MKLASLLSLLLTLSLESFAFSALPPEKPTLIVSIVVDNLSNEEISRHSHLLGNKGLLKIQNEGTRFSNATYPYASADKACDYSSISTGTSPRYHGVVSEEWYLPKGDKFESSTQSKKSIIIGSSTQGKGHDARKLIASTIGDELKISSHNQSKVFSISMNPAASVLLGGHAADGAYWLNSKSGKWITSDYYMSWLPDWVNSFNRKNYSEFYLTQDWVLTHAPIAYDIDKETYDEKVFPISLSEYNSVDKPYEILKSTPMGNMCILDFATQLLKSENLGKDKNTDLLYLNFTTITDKSINSGTYSIEKADFIVKLDKEIGRLTELLDKEIGTHNYLITLTSTKQKGLSVAELEKRRMPTGRFNPDRAKALLNSYLMALHGQGNWVLSFNKQQIYLNKELIEKSRLSFNDFQESVAAFMEEFEGIKWAIPAYKLKYADFNEGSFMAMQESYFPTRCGDVMISYYPGWAEEKKGYDVNFTYSHSNAVVPLMMYGWKMERNTISSKVFLTGLAPTLSTILNISIPNSSSKNLIYVDLENK